MEKEKNNLLVDLSSFLENENNAAEVSELLGVFRDEVGSLKLSRDETQQLSEELGIDRSITDAWKKASDFFDYFNEQRLIEKYSDKFTKLLGAGANLLAKKYPVVSKAKQVLYMIPEDVQKKIFKVAAEVAPLVVVGKIVHSIADKKQAQRDALLELIIAPSENSKRKLVVVCDDKLVTDCIISLMSGEDKDTDLLVLNSNAWEKIYSYHVPEKVVLVGKVKAEKELSDKELERFDKFGVTYSISTNRVKISTSLFALKERSVYNAFLGELKDIPVSDVLKDDASIKTDAAFFAKAFLLTPALLKDGYDTLNGIARQQLLYGVNSFCNNDFESFLMGR